MKTLKETIPGMMSNDWKERLVAEIEQCDIRLYNLRQHMQKIGKDSPEYSLLEAQENAMNGYLTILTTRAEAFLIDYKLPSKEEAMKSCCCCQACDFSSFDLGSFFIGYMFG